MMRWHTANNNRKKAERSWQRNGRWQALWPNLRENFERWCRGNEGWFMLPTETAQLYIPEAR